MAKEGEKPEKEKGAEEEVKKPSKRMVEFESLTFDVRDFNRFKRYQRQKIENKSGLEYVLTLLMQTPPYEEVFTYKTLEEREIAYELLRMRLQEFRVVFEVAKSMEEEDEPLSFEDPTDDDEEDLFDGLDELIEPS